MIRATAVALGGVVLASVLAGCAGSTAEEREAGAVAAARAYVAAIAARDPRTADAMTDPEVLEDRIAAGRETDVRAALADATEPIADPWVALASGTTSDDDREYFVDVSWRIRGAVGGARMAVRLEDGGDPDDVDDWTVTSPLVDGADVYVPARRSRIGSAELRASDGLASVEGYPGAYLAEPVDAEEDADPRSVVLGADVPITWHERIAHPYG